MMMKTAQRVSFWSLTLASNSLTRGFIPPHARIPRRNSIAVLHTATGRHQQATANISTTTFMLMYGGDFAGLSATFSATTGSLIPVPEYLVPPVLLEWGQGPSCFEVIVSEELHDDDSPMIRYTISVIPEVGCGVDNLDTMKSKQTIDTREARVLDDSVVALDTTLPDNNNNAMQCETVFILDNDGHRIRVMINVDHQQQRVIQTPITLVLERQTSTTSTSGTIADGGGLDGRTVSRLLGDLAKGKPFCELAPLIERQVDDCEGDNMTFLNLPGNVTISYSDNVLRVGHVTNESNQRVVTRNFSSDGTVEYEYSTAENK